MTHGKGLLTAAVFGSGALYALWVSRPNPVYRSSHLFEFPVEAVFDAYYPSPDTDLTGHPLDGVEFLFVGRGYAELRLPNGGIVEWRQSRPSQGAWLIGPITLKSHTFRAVDGGTQVDVELPCRFPTLWTRLQAPFMGAIEAGQRRDWLRTRMPEAARRLSFPMMKASPITGLIAAALLAVIAWVLGWQAAVGFALIFAANAVASAVAARWYGHDDSSVSLLGVTDVGTSANYAEVAAKAVAGPFGGLLAAALLFAACAMLQARDQMWLLSGLLYMHVSVLAPVSGVSGGALLRAILVSTGRWGAVVWRVLAASAIALVAYLFLWRNGDWWTSPFIALAGLAVLYDKPAADDLPKMGWRAITAAVLAYGALVAGHFGLAQLARTAVTSDRLIVVPLPDRVRALHLADGPDVSWDADRGAWWNAGTNRQAEWGGDLLAQREPDGSVSISLDPHWPFRLDLTDGRQCLARFSTRTDRLWQPRRLVLDETVISRFDCRAVAP